uniref:Uncharacterized protein n=1 Tax=Arundo donax TaxID=35708 RepID=A0A0A8YKI4_ARUDO
MPSAADLDGRCGTRLLAGHLGERKKDGVPRVGRGATEFFQARGADKGGGGLFHTLVTTNEVDFHFNLPGCLN